MSANHDDYVPELDGLNARLDEEEFGDDDYEPDGPLDCERCHGAGDVQCADIFNCTEEHDGFGCCPCPSCGGSGEV